VCCVPSGTVDLNSLSMTATDVTALVAEQIASFDANNASNVDAAFAALMGASVLEKMVRCTLGIRPPLDVLTKSLCVMAHSGSYLLGMSN